LQEKSNQDWGGYIEDPTFNVAAPGSAANPMLNAKPFNIPPELQNNLLGWKPDIKKGKAQGDIPETDEEFYRKLDKKKPIKKAAIPSAKTTLPSAVKPPAAKKTAPVKNTKDDTIGKNLKKSVDGLIGFLEKQSIWATDTQGNLLARKHGRELSRAEVESRNKTNNMGMVDPRNLKSPSPSDMRTAPVSKAGKVKEPFAVATSAAEKAGYTGFKEGEAGRKKRDEIAEAIKEKSLDKSVRKMEIPMINPFREQAQLLEN